MARIQELPDNYNESLVYDAKANSEAALPTPGPSLPPQMAEQKQSVDHLVKDLKRSPFFMTSLDDAGDEDNPELDAIRALIYEGTRAEIASNFREQGNEDARLKRWKEAKEFYTKGLAALEGERKDEDPSGEDENRKEAAIKELLLVNRALCHLEIQNYRSCTLDCLAALSINAQSIKAHYRMASAFFALGKLSEAASACKAGLTVDQSNAQFTSLSQRIQTRQAAQDEEDKKKQEERDRTKKEAGMVKIALKARQIAIRNTGQPPEMEDAAVKLVPDPLSPESTLVFPIVILYPLHLQTDFIKSFGEAETLQDHFDYLLPLPWDNLNEYTVKRVDAYIETAKGGLIKWGKKVELLKVLSGSMVEVVDGLVKVNIVPKSRASEWIESLKKRKSK